MSLRCGTRAQLRVPLLLGAPRRWACGACGTPLPRPQAAAAGRKITLVPTTHAADPQLVFTEVALGAIVLTVNVILLGGDIVFFQSMCLIGYCLFPINIAAIVCLFTKMRVRPWAGEVWGGAGALTAGWACFPLCSAATEGGRQHVHPHIDLQMQGSNRWCGLQHNRLVFGASSRLFRSGCG